MPMPQLIPGHFCYYVNAVQDVELHGGYVPSVVIENEAGHYPMEGDPTKHQAPWVWGKTLPVAEQLAREANARLGLTEDDVTRILMSSMRRTMPRMGT